MTDASVLEIAQKAATCYWYRARYFRQYNPSLDCDDLVQEARIAAFRARDAFDPARGVAVASFVAWRTNQGIKDALRRFDVLSRDQRAASHQGHFSPPIFVPLRSDHLQAGRSFDHVEACVTCAWILSRLSREDTDLLRAYFLGGKSQAAIAHSQHVSAPTISLRIAAALRRARKVVGH